MYNICEEYKKLKNVEVYTDIGFLPISVIMKTKKFKKYSIYFTSGKYIECADRHCFIDIDYNEITAELLSIGDFIVDEDGVDEVFDIINTNEEENFYDISMPEHHLYFTNGLLSHNSTLMANIAGRQVLKGYNVVLFTLEMCEDEFGRRFDGGFTGYDINRIYIKDTTPYKGFLKNIYSLIKNPNRGELYIKQFPTGEATRNDLRRYLRELKIRDVKIDVIYVDYINLMRPAIKTEGLYGAVKRIAEELRSLSYEFEAPVISVSQLNREGALLHFNDVNFNYTSESMGLPATCDFLGILGQPRDEFTYTQEVHCKIDKNRLGGRPGERFPLYYDSRSLRMYDQVELEKWMEDASLTNDEREVQTETGSDDE
jgi:hypothetical protein